MIYLTTQSGSQYEIDPVNKTWERKTTTAESGELRTEKGNYLQLFPIKLGEPIRLLAEALTPGALLRYIQTSPVVSYKEEFGDSYA